MTFTPFNAELYFVQTLLSNFVSIWTFLLYKSRAKVAREKFWAFNGTI
jgi:hypothetical protein